MRKEVNKFRGVSIVNRWKQRPFSRSDSWLIFGLQTWWASPYDYCYKLGFFGIDFQFWFKRSYNN